MSYLGNRRPSHGYLLKVNLAYTINHLKTLKMRVLLLAAQVENINNFI